MSKIKIQTNCPHCGKGFIADAEIPDPTPQKETAPLVRSKIRPVGSIMVYKITSEAMKKFIVQKAQAYCPGAKVEVVASYCEKKRHHNESGPHHSFASLRIGLSDDVLEKKEDYGWYQQIGESAGNTRFQKSIFGNLIKKYQFNRDDIDTWLHDYTMLERLEESLGITEAYLKELRTFAIPQRVSVKDGADWFMFAADASKVISDMLTNPETGKVIGSIQIADTYQVEKDVIEFLVHVYPEETEYRENPHVREILLGEEKPKKIK